MPKHDRTSISGDAQLLFHVPKASLVDFLLRTPPQELTTAYRAVARKSDEASKAALIGLNPSELIRVLLTCPSIPADTIKKLYEEHRYRGQKSLYLHDCEQLASIQPLDQKAFNAAVKKLEKSLREDSKDAGFSTVVLSSVEPVTLGTDQLEELSYGYIAPVPRVDPKTAYPDVVDDLRSGFIWLNYTTNWVAVCARDERSEERL